MYADAPRRQTRCWVGTAIPLAEQRPRRPPELLGFPHASAPKEATLSLYWMTGERPSSLFCVPSQLPLLPNPQPCRPPPAPAGAHVLSLILACWGAAMPCSYHGHDRRPAWAVECPLPINPVFNLFSNSPAQCNFRVERLQDHHACAWISSMGAELQTSASCRRWPQARNVLRWKRSSFVVRVSLLHVE
jgi:hypothetical protein